MLGRYDPNDPSTMTVYLARETSTWCGDVRGLSVVQGVIVAAVLDIYPVLLPRRLGTQIWVLIPRSGYLRMGSYR